MEEYTVSKKGTDEIYYVLQMAKSQQDIILLANYETGEFVVINMQQLMMSYEFNELLEDMEDESEGEDTDEDVVEDEGDEEVEEAPVNPSYPPQQPVQVENRFVPQ